MNILLVDDEMVMVNILKRSIDWSALGIDNVFSAYNAGQARRRMEQKPVEILLCDIEMPDENGLELIEWVHQRYLGTLSIILTGHADFSYAQNAVSAGAFHFMLKPVVYSDLQKVISRAVKEIERRRVNDQYKKYGEYFALQSNPDESVEGMIDTFVGQARRQNTELKREDSPVELVKGYLEKHYSEPVNRSEIEGLVHLNSDYLNRIFKEETGFTLMEYIQYYRISMAKSLLLNSKASINEISLNVGYDSSAYFCKLFKKWTDVTPAEYRSKMTGKKEF